jgi:hypothetical protein
MKVLVGCEESQAVTIELRKLGHEAYSCDTKDCSGGHPEWHIKGDVLQFLDKNKYNDFQGWDMGIFFPPCTFLTTTANRWYNPEYNLQYDLFDGLVTRNDKRKEAIKFFKALANAPIDKIALENPVVVMSTEWRKPDQIINPYNFGDPYQKRTCIWVKNLNVLKLDFTDNVDKGEFFEWKDKKTGKTRRQPLWYFEARRGDHSTNRSKTFPGIAKAMAEQWT